MCNHDYESKENTLELLPILKLSYPPTKVYQCKICGEVFNVKEKDVKNFEE